MYHKWIQWQEDAGLESQLAVLRRKRKDAKINIFCLQKVESRLLSELATIRAVIVREKMIYHKLDEQMAEVDGRRYSIREMAEFFKEESSIRKSLKRMSKDDRMRLLEELKKLK